MKEEIKYVFVYGSLKKGFKNNEKIKAYKNIGEAMTKDKFLMYPSQNYEFPFMFDTIDYKNFHTPKKIHGELIESCSDIIEELDRFENVQNDLYAREIIDIELKNNVIIKAYVYIANRVFLEEDEEYIDLLPESLDKWTKENEFNGIMSEAYIRSLRSGI